jgi:D-amino-acid dehydrogenase
VAQTIGVVGGGIVGLAIAREMVRAGARVTLIDRELGGDKASLGNAGALAVCEVVPASTPGVAWRALGWMLDPLGPLSIRPAYAPRLIPWLVRFARVGTPGEVERISRALAALNGRVYEDWVPLLSDLGLAGDLHRKGALTLYETAAGYRRDADEWQRKRALGVEMQELSGAQAREMEPALAERVQQAIFTPQWSYVSDPRKIVARLGEWLAGQGVSLVRGEVVAIIDAGAGVSIQLREGERIAAERVVIAAGAWSGQLARGLGDRVLLESERGYNTTLPNPGIRLERQLIFAERKFVATPLECGLRIGGAAEFGGLEARADYRRSHKLLELAKRYLPALQTEGGTVWAGHRPATPDSLPVIGRSPRRARVLYAFGHGHLGLTQAATTARLIGDLLAQRAPAIDVTPYGIERFA